MAKPTVYPEGEGGPLRVRVIERSSKASRPDLAIFTPDAYGMHGPIASLARRLGGENRVVAYYSARGQQGVAGEFSIANSVADLFAVVDELSMEYDARRVHIVATCGGVYAALELGGKGGGIDTIAALSLCPEPWRHRARVERLFGEESIVSSPDFEWEYDVWPTLPRVTVPVLLMNCSDDHSQRRSPRRFYPLLRDKLPKAAWIEMDRVSYDAGTEDHDMWVGLLEGFWRGVEAAGH